MGWFRRTFGFLDPGPSRYNDRPGPFGPSPSPYDPSVQWDPQGFPMGPMPRGGDMPLEYQYEANRRTEQRRQALWGDAQGSIRSGLDLLQSYRPGGSAALASGMFGQSAGLYGQQAQALEAPDLLIDWRRDKQAKADIEAKRAQRFNQVMGVLQLGAGVAGAAAGGGAAAGAASMPPAAPIGTAMAGGQTSLGPGPGYAGGLDPGQIGQPYSGPMARPAGMLQPATMVGAPGMTPGAPDMIPGGGGGGSAPGGGGGSARRGKMGAPGGGGGPAAPGPAGGGAGPGAGGSVGADGNFTQTAVAANRAATSPVMASMIADEVAEDPRRRFKTSLMSNYAMRELALAGA